MKQADLTRLIGMVAIMRDNETSGPRRRRLKRLVTDLCEVASALRALELDEPNVSRIGECERLRGRE